MPTIEESIARLEAVTVDQVRKLYDGAARRPAGELVVVGDFDPPTGPQAGGGGAEGLEGEDAVQARSSGRPWTDVKGERIVIETPDKANAVYLAG